MKIIEGKHNINEQQPISNQVEEIFSNKLSDFTKNICRSNQSKQPADTYGPNRHP